MTSASFAEDDEIRPIPDAAEAALSPQDTKTNDQLFLTGLHLEQYRHATWSALDYYEEALRRDPNDVRCLNQMGLWYLRRGRFSKAEEYLRRAVKIWQKRNPNPYDGEAIFNLALCLKYQYRLQEAYGFFWKSTWNKAWADAGYFEAACISMSEGRYEDALDEVERSLSFNSNNHKARALKAAVLRKLERNEEALLWVAESYKKDHFNYGCMLEEHLLTGNQEPLDRIVELMHGNVYNYHELAIDYAQTGLWQECIDVLQMEDAQNHPMTYYHMGFALSMMGEQARLKAKECFKKAEQTDSYCCFPNRLDDILALECAKALNPEGAKAPYYLGCLYYDKRQYDVAIANWERSSELDATFPSVWRNLALARFNKQDQQNEALEMMKKAFSLDETDSRILMELDQLFKRLQMPHTDRLEFLQKYPQLIAQRDDLVLEEITLLNQLGRYEEAMEKLDAHIFHPWEGGEGKVPTQYQICRVELALRAIAAKDYNKAIALLEECLEYPHHLGEGKLYGAQENDFYYLLGIAYDALGKKDKSRECWEEATKGPQEPAAAMYYNDAKPDKIFYQGMALYKLGRDGEAHGRFFKLINYGKQHIFEKQVMDYFAVSLPDLLIWEGSGENQLSELDLKNHIHCKYMLALGYYGMGDRKHAERYLREVETLDNNHQGIQQLRTLIDSGL
jgi:tetratricopeptide (TPR) repeat protein